jgi:4-amino-4-deoxy-L-arabinose transferase-like glycosyltransferase
MVSLPWGWLALLLGSVLLYLFGLDSPYAPTNGDEMVYLHIARMTAESGQWLPLQSELANMRNTKPPLLFWQAIVAGGWGQHWTLFALRLPSVFYTLASTAGIGWFAYLMAGRTSEPVNPSPDTHHKAVRCACVAMVLFLLFFSSFRYSRVYLTSAPETFWLALPLWWALWLALKQDRQSSQTVPAPGLLGYIGFGCAMGLGAAYKSFALLAPAAATLWCALLCVQPALNRRDVARITAGVGLSTLLGLGFFALWFALDPNPAAVWQEFVVGENAGKLSDAQGYWQAAWSGTYPMWTQLYAYPENAGTLFFLALGVFWLLAPYALRRANWQGLTPASRVLLVWLLVWLVVFSLPSQRSARYLIPAMPALAITMALLWNRLARPWFWLTLVLLAPGLVVLARIGWTMGELGMADTLEVALMWLAAGVGLTAVAAGFLHTKWLKPATLTCTLALYGTFGAMVAPISGTRAGFDPIIQERLAGQRLAVPNGFTGQFERYHFLLPQTQLRPYDAEGRNAGEGYPELEPAARLERLLEESDAVVWIQEQLEDAHPLCVPQCTLLASRWHVKSRHKSGEVTLDNLWFPQQWLFRREWLLVRTAKLT